MEDCLFCKIVRGDIPSQKVFEDEDTYAFKDIHPVAPVHILVIPKKHIPSLAHIGTEENLMGRLMTRAAEIAASEGLNEKGYRVVNNIGEHGGQTVHHLHLHILGGRHMAWPPG